MVKTPSYFEYIKGQLSSLGPFETKKMFGGIGFFKDGKMFGMISDNVFRLKADQSTQSDFEKRGMKPYHSEAKKKGMPYWEVPPKIIENKKSLSQWATKAINLEDKSKK